MLGAIAGILLADYYLVRQGELKVDDLYRRNGAYEYGNGWNIHAIIAFALGVLPCLPGYLVVSGVLDKASVNPGLVSLFDFGWFFSLLVAGAYYTITAKRS
ncbi:putative allantoin permease [mine drainage metagenome]|uniref:Putative allantoin permease n=1 Tax=mine drainage metagenome TaxID=410659 RepID=A0A1J5PPG6_9ZZZZ